METTDHIEQACDGVSICVVPTLDGTSAYFRHIRAKLPSQSVVRHLDSPGLFDGAEPLVSIEALARRHIESLGVWKDKPLLIVGWSFASLVAFHMVWLLEHNPAVRLVSIDPVWAMRGEEHRAHRLLAMDASRYAAVHSMQERIVVANERARQSYKPRRTVAVGLYLIASEHPDENLERLYKLHCHPNQVSVVRVPGNHRSIIEGTGAELIASSISMYSATGLASASYKQTS